jgi:hypothetical protein
MEYRQFAITAKDIFGLILLSDSDGNPRFTLCKLVGSAWKPVVGRGRGASPVVAEANLSAAQWHAKVFFGKLAYTLHRLPIGNLPTPNLIFDIAKVKGS